MDLVQYTGCDVSRGNASCLILLKSIHQQGTLLFVLFSRNTAAPRKENDVKDKQTAGFIQTKPNSDDGKAIVRTDECRELRCTPLYDHKSKITPSANRTKQRKQYTKYGENIDSNDNNKLRTFQA